MLGNMNGCDMTVETSWNLYLLSQCHLTSNFTVCVLQCCHLNTHCVTTCLFIPALSTAWAQQRVWPKPSACSCKLRETDLFVESQYNPSTQNWQFDSQWSYYGAVAKVSHANDEWLLSDYLVTEAKVFGVQATATHPALSKHYWTDCHPICITPLGPWGWRVKEKWWGATRHNCFWSARSIWTTRFL